MATQSLSIVVLSTDFNNLNEIRAALTTDSRTKLLSGGNDVKQIQEEIVRFKPSVAMICLGPESDQAIKLIQHIKTECPQTAIISIAREKSSERILQSLRAGANEFLRLPIDADELKTVLDRISEFIANQAKVAEKTGRMTAIFSYKGGCGASFIAANLAASATARTVLVDLNFESGDLPIFFGLNPEFSIADLVARYKQLDESLVSNLVTPCSENLDLISAPKELDPIDKIEPKHIFGVLQQLREYYDHIFLDLRHTFDSITLMVLEQCDEIVLVFSLDLLSINGAKRAVQSFDQEGYPESKIQIVVNRWSKQVDWDLPEVEKYLRRKIVATISSHYPTVVDSINRGIPLVKSNPRSEIAREIKNFARALSIIKSQEEEPARFWGLFRKNQAEGILDPQKK